MTLHYDNEYNESVDNIWWVYADGSFAYVCKFLFVYLLYSVCCRSSGGSGSHGGVVLWFVTCALFKKWIFWSERCLVFEKG